MSTPYESGVKVACELYGVKDAGLISGAKKVVNGLALTGLLAGGGMGMTRPAPHGFVHSASNALLGAGGGAVGSVAMPLARGFQGAQEGGALGALKGVVSGLVNGIPDGANWALNASPLNRN